MESNEGQFGMALPPDKLEALRQAKEAAGVPIEEEIDEPSGPRPQVVMRNDMFPDGVKEGDPLGLAQELRHIIYALHWQFQKQILDIVQAAIGHNEQQWPVVRKLIMDVQVAQIKTQVRAVQQRVIEEEKGDGGLRFERRTEGD